MFCFHKWGKWEDATPDGNLAPRDIFSSHKIKQFRQCARCNLKQTPEQQPKLVDAFPFFLIGMVIVMSLCVLLKPAHAQDGDSNSSVATPNTDGTVTVTEYGE